MVPFVLLFIFSDDFSLNIDLPVLPIGNFYSKFVSACFIAVYLGFGQMFYLPPMIYFLRRRNHFGLARGLFIGAITVFFFCISSFIYLTSLEKITGTRSISFILSPNVNFHAQLLEHYSQKKSILSFTKADRNSAPNESSYFVQIGQTYNGGTRVKNKRDNIYHDSCFSAESITPPGSLKINWKGSEQLEIHYQNAKILWCRPSWWVQDERGRNKFIKIKLIQDKTEK